jgi:hypothetical protein
MENAQNGQRQNGPQDQPVSGDFEGLFPAEAKIEQFLTDLAVNGQVPASIQNPAFNALLFLYREVLHRAFDNILAVRADRPVRLPEVLIPEEARQVIVAMSGMPQLVVKLQYGSGLRLLEAFAPRIWGCLYADSVGTEISRSSQGVAMAV